MRSDLIHGDHSGRASQGTNMKICQIQEGCVEPGSSLLLPEAPAVQSRENAEIDDSGGHQHVLLPHHPEYLTGASSHSKFTPPVKLSGGDHCR